jgi:phage-related baseplate assembly protein
MSRSTTPLEGLDLGRLPAPTLVPVDFEAQLADRIADLTTRYTAVGIPYDVGGLETDPGIILAQSDNYRETLVRQAINDAAKRLTLGFAAGADLDRIAATFYASLGLRRLEGESDARFERRILLAPEAYAGAQSAGGIVFLALAADLRVIDARAIKHGAGDVECIVLAAPADEAAAVLAVRAVLQSPSIRPATVPIAVRAATRHPVAATVRVVVRPGPDPALVRTQAQAGVDALAAELGRSIGAGLILDAIKRAAWVGDVLRPFVDAPADDLDPGEDGVVVLTATVTAEVAT